MYFVHRQVMENKSEKHMDSKHSWIIMAATFQINFIVFGLLKSGGVFYVGIYQTYNADRSDVALITVTTFGFMFIASVFGSSIIQWIGFRRTFFLAVWITFFGMFFSYFIYEYQYYIITLGVILGSGIGIGFVPVMSILTRFFKVHLAKASGLSLAGSSIGTISIPPLTEYLIDEFGLRGMFLLMSGVVLNTFISVCFIHDPPNEMPVNDTTSSHNKKNSSQKMTSGDSNAELTVNNDDTMSLQKVNKTENIITGNINVNFDKDESKTDNIEITIGSHQSVEVKSSNPGVSKKLKKYQKLFQSLRSAFITHLGYFKNPYFTMIILGYLFMNIVVPLYSISIPDIGLRSGGSLINGAFLISVTSVCDLVGRILIGTLIDKRFINLGYSYGITILLNGLIVICIGIFEKDTYSLHMVLCGLFGFAYSSLLIHFTVVIAHYVGPTSVPTVISLGSILVAVQTVLLREKRIFVSLFHRINLVFSILFLLYTLHMNSMWRYFIGKVRLQNPGQLQPFNCVCCLVMENKNEKHMDSRHSWIIMAATFQINFMVFGLLKSGGVFYVGIYQAYNADRAEVARITVTTFGCMSIASVFGSSIINWIGFRRTFFLSVWVTFFGMFFSYFIYEYQYFIITLGVILAPSYLFDLISVRNTVNKTGSSNEMIFNVPDYAQEHYGALAFSVTVPRLWSALRIGIGIGFVPVMSIVARFFKVHLAKASGISLAGSSIGTITIPPLTEYLIEEFGLRGMFLLMSGVVLNTFISVCFIHDPPKEIPVDDSISSHKEKSFLKNLTPGYSNAELTVSNGDTMNLQEVNKAENIITGNIDVNFVKNESIIDNIEITNGSHQPVKEESSNNDPCVSKKRANCLKRFQSMRSSCITHLKYFKNPYFTMIIFGYILLHTILQLYSISIPDIGLRSGGSLINGAFLISVTSVSDLVGRIAVGTLIDKRLTCLGYSYGITILLNGIIVICIGIFEKDTYSVHMVLCVLFGFTYSGLLIHFAVIVSHYLGPTLVPTVMSLGSILVAVQTVLLAEILNYFLRTFNGYAYLYFIIGGLLVSLALFWIGVGIKETLASRLTKIENRNTVK
ncbi:Monocarboxylate transporter 14 [Nymphon striatum]|nr:Monocarboxylate transporter 14 [Nymphon striatum]